MVTVRQLTCCCCGSDAGRWQQHWNRDTGYGVCAKCVDWVRSRGESEDEIASNYGKEGVNWGRVYNIIRWPDSNGEWWLVAETGTDGSYTPLLEIKGTTGKCTEPTYPNQLWQAAKLLVDKGIEAVSNPHAMIGKDCGCRGCFCCAAQEVVSRARQIFQTA